MNLLTAQKRSNQHACRLASAPQGRFGLDNQAGSLAARMDSSGAPEELRTSGGNACREHTARAGLCRLLRVDGFGFDDRYVEEWATEADMRLRVRSDRFTSVLAIVESAREADVHFDFVTTTRGLEYVEEAGKKPCRQR